MLRIKECKALARRTLLGRYRTVIAAYFITIVIQALMWILTAASGAMTMFYAGVFGSLMGTGMAFSLPKLICGVMLTMFLLVAAVIVSLWFEIGQTRLMLNICRGLKASVKDVFYGFGEGHDTLCYIMTGVVLGLISCGINAVQRLLYMLAGLIFTNSMARTAAVLIITVITLLLLWYIATTFMLAKIVIADKRESTISGALTASHRLMKGRKLKGFWLMYFSFLFWYILIFICAPAALWVSPYIACTGIIFYMDADGTLWQLPGEHDAPQETEPQDTEEYADREAKAAATYEENAETADDAVSAEDQEQSQDLQPDIDEKADSYTSADEENAETAQDDATDNTEYYQDNISTAEAAAGEVAEPAESAETSKTSETSENVQASVDDSQQEDTVL